MEYPDIGASDYDLPPIIPLRSNSGLDRSTTGWTGWTSCGIGTCALCRNHHGRVNSRESRKDPHIDNCSTL